MKKKLLVLFSAVLFLLAIVPATATSSVQFENLTFRPQGELEGQDVVGVMGSDDPVLDDMIVITPYSKVSSATEDIAELLNDAKADVDGKKINFQSLIGSDAEVLDIFDISWVGQDGPESAVKVQVNYDESSDYIILHKKGGVQGSWVKENATINKSEKYFELNTSLFSAFVIVKKSGSNTPNIPNTADKGL
jgi:hypothetical protein